VIVALKQAIPMAIWNMFQIGTTYNDPGGEFHARRMPDKTKTRALNQLRRLGRIVTLESTAEVAKEAIFAPEGSAQLTNRFNGASEINGV
jgi:hypothetical protein